MLQGKRVTLRPREREDAPRLHELMNREIDLVMCGHSDWIPRPLAAIEHRFNKHLADQDRADFVIVADGVVIGDIGLHSWGWNRRTGVSEFGISIYDRDYVGKGYGREALNLLLEWAFRVQNWRRIWLTTLASNERAIRSYRSCGFVEEGRLREHDFFDGRYDDLVIMGLLRSEWESGRMRNEG